MKTIFRFFIFFTVLSGFLLTGCDPLAEDPSGDDLRDPFIGVWQFVESTKSTEAQSYIVTISKDPGNSSQVILENFGNPGTAAVSVTGLVTSNQVVISSQNLDNGWTIEGTGKITNVAKTAMSWTYSIIAGGDKEYYTATANRQ